MWRKIIYVFFVTSCFTALYLFYNKDNFSVKDKLERANSEKPLVQLYNFSFRNYSAKKVKRQLSAEKALLLSDSVVEINGKVIGFELKNEINTKSVRADSVLAYLLHEQSNGSNDNATLETAYLKGKVEISNQAHKIKTEFAKYTHKQNLIESDKPVRVEGEGLWVSGRDGFRLFLKKEDLEVFGNVQGVYLPKEEAK